MKSKNKVITYAAFFVLLLVVLATALAWLLPKDFTQSRALAFAALPMIAGIFVLVAVVSAIRSMDEMQRAIQLEALAIAVGGMFMVFIVQITLDMAGRPVAINPGNNLMIMDALYLVGFLFGRRRYV